MAVAPVISAMTRTSTRWRPCESPRRPRTMAPMGRTRNAVPYNANAESRIWSSSGKKTATITVPSAP